MPRQARITRAIEYRVGDGPMTEIRPGPCEVEETPLDVTVSWQDGATLGATAIPVDDFQRHLGSGAIVWV